MAAVNLVHTAFESADGRTAKVWLGEAEQDHGLASLKGGHVMPLCDGVVLAGTGERSSPQGACQLARSLFAAGAATGHHPSRTRARKGGRHGTPAPEWQEHRADFREVTDA